MDAEGGRRPHAKIEEEIGDLLFVVANLARHLKVEPENALRAANEKFSRRFRFIEQQPSCRRKISARRFPRRNGGPLAAGQAHGTRRAGMSRSVRLPAAALLLMLMPLSSADAADVILRGGAHLHAQSASTLGHRAGDFARTHRLCGRRCRRAAAQQICRHSRPAGPHGASGLPRCPRRTR